MDRHSYLPPSSGIRRICIAPSIQHQQVAGINGQQQDSDGTSIVPAWGVRLCAPAWICCPHSSAPRFRLSRTVARSCSAADALYSCILEAVSRILALERAQSPVPESDLQEAEPLWLMECKGSRSHNQYPFPSKTVDRIYRCSG